MSRLRLGTSNIRRKRNAMEGVIGLLGTYGYLVLFLGVVVEGEIFPLAAGALAAMSFMNMYAVIVVTFVGAVVGDILWFLAARHWGRKLVERFGRFFFRRKRLARLEKHFQVNGKRTLFITKFIYSFGHSSIVVAGIAGMDIREFIKIDVVASLLWACLFVLLGSFFGASLGLLQHFMRDITWFVVVALVVIIVVQWYARKRLARTL